MFNGPIEVRVGAAKGSLRGTVGSGGPSLQLRTSNNTSVGGAE